MFRCAPVVYGQGFGAVGPVDDAMYQKVSGSVHQAQEEQHLADLAAEHAEAGCCAGAEQQPRSVRCTEH